MTTLFPGLKTVVTGEFSVLAEHVAQSIARLVRHKPDAVLGLATGSTPLAIYEALVRCHTEERLDFSRVTCFNLDEYYPMHPSSANSYHYYMQDHLFSKINCKSWHIPDGCVQSAQAIEMACLDYEKRILDAGGIDLQLLGIGRNGHIGFNEPGSDRSSRTRLVELDRETREDASGDFEHQRDVPQQAITMGIATILEAREIILVAQGKRKSQIIKAAMEGPVTHMIPASHLQEHPGVTWCLDCLLENSLSQLL